MKKLSLTPCVVSGPAPLSRRYSSTVAVGERLVVFGGAGKSGHMNDCHSLCLSSWKWTQVDTTARYLVPRRCHCAVAIGSKLMIIFGGESRQGHRLSDVWRLDAGTLKWTMLREDGSDHRRMASAAAVLGEKIYRFGGLECWSPNNDLHFAESESWESLCEGAFPPWTLMEVSGSVPSPRQECTLVPCGSSLFLWGGGLTANGGWKAFHDLYEFDAVNNCWTKVETCGSQPIDFWPGQMVHLKADDLLLLMGCGSTNNALYDLASKHWLSQANDQAEEHSRAFRVSTEMPSPCNWQRCCPAAIAYGDGAIVLGEKELNSPVVVLKVAISELHLPDWRHFGRRMWDEDSPYCDVVFSVGDVHIRAHRLVLSQHPCFASWFGDSSDDTKPLEVQIEGVQPSAFRELLRFIYTGSVDERWMGEEVSKKDAFMQLLATADRFLAPSLKEVCEDHLIPEIDDENCCELFSAAVKCNSPRLKDAARYHLSWNFFAVASVSADGFSGISAKDISENPYGA